MAVPPPPASLWEEEEEPGAPVAVADPVEGVRMEEGLVLPPAAAAAAAIAAAVAEAAATTELYRDLVTEGGQRA